MKSEKITVPVRLLRAVVNDMDFAPRTYTNWGWTIEDGPTISIRRVGTDDLLEIEITSPSKEPP